MLSIGASLATSSAYGHTTLNAPVSSRWGPRVPIFIWNQGPCLRLHNILVTLGSPFSCEIRDPSMKMGTPMQFIFSLPILMLASCYYDIIFKDIWRWHIYPLITRVNPYIRWNIDALFMIPLSTSIAGYQPPSMGTFRQTTRAVYTYGVFLSSSFPV